MMGRLTLEQERHVTETAKVMIESQSDLHPAYRSYLDQWGDWTDPFANMSSSSSKSAPKEIVAKAQ